MSSSISVSDMETDIDIDIDIEILICQECKNTNGVMMFLCDHLQIHEKCINNRTNIYCKYCKGTFAGYRPSIYEPHILHQTYVI
jgi:hypothetical protein